MAQNLSYTDDLLGNPLSRSDANTGMSESFTYDGLNRPNLGDRQSQPGPRVKIFAYSAIGNMLSKSDVGTYGYPAAGSPLPHAAMNVSGGNISSTFTYDANGNQTAGLGRGRSKPRADHAARSRRPVSRSVVQAELFEI